LGTGSGYVAFALAAQNSGCKVIGIDIVADTLKMNTDKAKVLGNENLKFISYNGVHYPFDDNCFDTIVTRYALHHLPDLASSFDEMYRVLKKGGKLIISDPTPNRNDTVGFVDAFMKMKPDGHNKFYFFEEFNEMLLRAGFQFELQKNTTIKFPRKFPKDYEGLLIEYDKEIYEGYEIEIVNNEIWIKENVLNLVYRKF
jgi:ubiquinone/menaquinone biosynthesis C-methylase UbiE